MPLTNETPLTLGPEDLAYCADAVRRQDPERYAAAMLAGGTSRDAMLVLLAFNQEIAKTREVVSEPTIGLIRLQWWRDAVGEAYRGNARRHQVVTPLAAVLTGRNLDPAKVEGLISARETDLEASPFGDLNSILAYAEATNGALHDLLADALQVPEEREDDRAAIRDGAVAWALTGIIRAVPHAIQDGLVALPDALLQEQGLTPQKITDRPNGEGLKPVIRPIAEAAADRLDRSSAFRGGEARSAPLLALNRLTRHRLQALQAADHDVFDPRLQQPVPFAALRMAWAKWRNRF